MLDILAGERIPVFVVTGFLGAGKTTLLRRLLASGALRDTALIVNEFASLGIDQLLVRQVSEQVVLLDAGCVCCTVREDLLQALRELFIDRLRGETGPFRRVVIETSGLGDPVPVLHTLQTDPFLRERFRLGGTVTLVDGCQELEEVLAYPEGRRQVAVADRYVLTKCDLAPPEVLARTASALAGANPEAGISRNGAEDLGALVQFLELGAGAARGRRDPLAGFVGRRLGRHRSRVQSFVLQAPGSLAWDDFVAWVQALQAQPVLRMKGVLRVQGQEQPVLVQAVRHVFHPSELLATAAWQDGGSRVVLILENPERLPSAELLTTVLAPKGGLRWQVQEEEGAGAAARAGELQPL